MKEVAFKLIVGAAVLPCCFAGAAASADSQKSQGQRVEAAVLSAVVVVSVFSAVVSHIAYDGGGGADSW